MFCLHCGTELPDEAKFCVACGKSLASAQKKKQEAREESEGAKVTPLKCSSCAATLEVEAGEKIAVCPFCQTKHIVDQGDDDHDIIIDLDALDALDDMDDMFEGNGNVNYKETVIVNGKVIHNSSAAAGAVGGIVSQAFGLANEALGTDFFKGNAAQKQGAGQAAAFNGIYYQTEAAAGTKQTPGWLQLKQGVLVFRSNTGDEKAYELRKMSDIKQKQGNILVFDYGFGDRSFRCSNPMEWVSLLWNAQGGRYPAVR